MRVPDLVVIRRRVLLDRSVRRYFVDNTLDVMWRGGVARLTVVTITRHIICIYTILNVGVSRAGCIGTMKSRKCSRPARFHFVEVFCSLDVRYLLFSNDRFVATYIGERSKRDFNLNIARRRVFSWDFE